MNFVYLVQLLLINASGISGRTQVIKFTVKYGCPVEIIDIIVRCTCMRLKKYRNEKIIITSDCLIEKIILL